MTVIHDQLGNAITEFPEVSGERVMPVKGYGGYVAIYGYRSSDGTFQPLRLDKATNSIQTIEYEHHEIHAGSHFFYNDSTSLNAAGTQNYLITTPNTTKWAHLVFAATGSLITQVDLYENSDRVGTTVQKVFNSDRNSTTDPTVKVHKDTSGGTTNGTLIWTMKTGNTTGQSRVGLTAERSNEIILGQNKKYLFIITSGSASNLINIQLQWYEHQNVA